jgi:hypothetical protein
MGDLNEARLLAVRTLLQRAPDFAVQSLSSLLASDRSEDQNIKRVRQLVGAEARDRRFRSAAFEPLAGLWKTHAAIPFLSFPSTTPSLLWQAVKDYEPSFAHRLQTTAEPAAGRPETLALFNDICTAAADGLSHRATPGFAALADLLDAHPKGCSRLATLLTLAPDLRDSIARAPTWLSGVDPEHAAALRIAFRQASEKGPEAGFLYMEVLFAALEQPAFILRLVSMIMDRPSDRFLAASELRTIGERLLDAVDRHVGAIKDFDPARGLEGGVAAAAASDAATLIISEFETHVAMSREGVWGARIVQQRQALTLAMEMRLREVEAATNAALPMRTMRVNGKFLRGPPNLSQPPDPLAVAKVMSLTALLSGCRTAALVTGFGALRSKVLEIQDKALDGYIQDVLDMLHRQQVPAELGRAYLDVAAELFGLVRDPKAADLVRRRAVAATSTAA